VIGLILLVVFLMVRFDRLERANTATAAVAMPTTVAPTTTTTLAAG